jgi:PilZ domain
MGWKPRIEPRYRIEVDAKARSVGSFQWYPAKVINLSRAGACLHTKATLDGRLELDLEILVTSAPSDSGGASTGPLIRKVRAVILWQKGWRYGLKFVRASEKSA